MKLTKRLKTVYEFLLSRKKKRIISAAVTIVALIVLLPSAYQASAATVSVEINGKSLYHSKDLLRSGVTYVPLRAFSDYIGEFRITWNNTTRTAIVQDENLKITAKVGNYYITANGDRISSTVPNVLISNRIYVPIRSISQAMGLDVAWNGNRRIASVSGDYHTADAVPPVDDDSIAESVNQEDLYWLSRIIHAESQGEPMAGKIAVGTVVLNRVASDQYPDSVYDVIFDRKYGTQFTPVATGTIYNDPSAESIEAARRCLLGERTDSRILFFVNEKLAPNNWMSKNRTYILTIGNHKFYA